MSYRSVFYYLLIPITIFLYEYIISLFIYFTNVHDVFNVTSIQTQAMFTSFTAGTVALLAAFSLIFYLRKAKYSYYIYTLVWIVVVYLLWILRGPMRMS